MAIARFRFHGELAEFLPPARRGEAFEYACARAASLKNAIEALGVPHTEVGQLRIDGERATLDRTVREGDVVEVFPWSGDAAEAPGTHDLFLADAHLVGWRQRRTLLRVLRVLALRHVLTGTPRVGVVHPEVLVAAADVAEAHRRRLHRDRPVERAILERRRQTRQRVRTNHNVGIDEKDDVAARFTHTPVAGTRWAKPSATGDDLATVVFSYLA